MDSDGPTDPEASTSVDDEDYDVIEAWTSDGRGLAFDGRVVEHFPDGGPTVRMHVRNIDAGVRQGVAGSAEVTLKSGGMSQSIPIAAIDVPAFEEVVETINATRELLDAESGLDHW